MSDQLILGHDIDVFLPVSGMVRLCGYVSIMSVLVMTFGGIVHNVFSRVVIVVFFVVRLSVLLI